MLKQDAVLEVKKEERVYRLHLNNDSPLGEVFDVISEMQSFIIEKMKNSIPEKQDDKKAE